MRWCDYAGYGFERREAEKMHRQVLRTLMQAKCSQQPQRIWMEEPDRREEVLVHVLSNHPEALGGTIETRGPFIIFDTTADEVLERQAELIQQANVSSVYRILAGRDPDDDMYLYRRGQL